MPQETLRNPLTEDLSAEALSRPGTVFHVEEADRAGWAIGPWRGLRLKCLRVGQPCGDSSLLAEMIGNAAWLNRRRALEIGPRRLLAG
jgi:hypothetical protein